MDQLWTFLLIGLAICFPLLVAVAVLKVSFAKKSRGEPFEVDKETLAAAEKALRAEGELDWVVLKRCHGPAYNHSAMTEIVSALSAGGVQATYDVIASSSADGGVTNYVVKVIRGQESLGHEILSGLESSKTI
jgi:hypothetical protein